MGATFSAPPPACGGVTFGFQPFLQVLTGVTRGRGFNLHFPVGHNLEYLFMCLSPVFVSSLVKCLFMYFARFLMQLFAFLLLSFENLHIPVTSPLSGTWLESMFSRSAASPSSGDLSHSESF